MHSPTYKHGKYTKDMQIKHLIAYKSIEIALKYTKMTKSKKTSYLTLEWNKNNNASSNILLDHYHIFGLLL